MAEVRWNFCFFEDEDSNHQHLLKFLIFVLLWRAVFVVDADWDHPAACQEWELTRERAEERRARGQARTTRWPAQKSHWWSCLVSDSWVGSLTNYSKESCWISNWACETILHSFNDLILLLPFLEDNHDSFVQALHSYFDVVEKIDGLCRIDALFISKSTTSLCVLRSCSPRGILLRFCLMYCRF